mgnify:CR=1 FL=1
MKDLKVDETNWYKLKLSAKRKEIFLDLIPLINLFIILFSPSILGKVISTIALLFSFTAIIIIKKIINKNSQM